MPRVTSIKNLADFNRQRSQSIDMLTRRTTFRLYPSDTQRAQLFEMRRLHCTLYNSAIADRKDSYQKLGKSVSYFDQQNQLPAFKKVWPEFIALGSQGG